jgi:hypothetical protein
MMAKNGRMLTRWVAARRAPARPGCSTCEDLPKTLEGPRPALGAAGLPPANCSNIAAMRCCVVVVLWVAFAPPAFGQEPLTIAAALEEAISSNPELVAIRRDAASDRLPPLVRATKVLGNVRRAYVELSSARARLELYVGQSPLLKEMANAAALQPRSGGMARHDPSAMIVDIARLASARVTAQEDVKVAEFRLNEVLGRRVDAAVEPLAMLEEISEGANAVETALARDPRLATAQPSRRDALTAAIRRRVLEAQAGVDGARERAAIMTRTVLPQVALGFDTARAAYAAHQGGFFEMLDAHHRHLAALVEAAAASADHARAVVALEIAIGETPERLARAAGSGGAGN